ncbi:hypothetical protein BX600DRAFT_450859 [Xylariales sp. PMI_506]|nr:hypothetical protein BX600DRAFT_450859 [Xylariales sp. PMI_506]
MSAKIKRWVLLLGACRSSVAEVVLCLRPELQRARNAGCQDGGAARPEGWVDTKAEKLDVQYSQGVPDLDNGP